MNKNRIFMVFGVLVLTALACNLPSGTSTPTDDATATQVFAATTTGETQEQNPSNTQETLTATDTLAPSLTPTISPTATPSIPMVSVSVNTNCRKGPGIVYDNLTALLVGEEAVVVGKHTATDPDYWIIEKGSITCWLWGEYATVVGDVSNLPEIAAPPTPTPSPTPTATATSTITPSPTP
ncbi:MAG: hypothetical protein ACK2T5_13785 [Anaerolineales bacterium]